MLDSGGVTRLAERSRDAAALISALRDQGLWRFSGGKLPRGLTRTGTTSSRSHTAFTMALVCAATAPAANDSTSRPYALSKPRHTDARRRDITWQHFCSRPHRVLDDAQFSFCSRQTLAMTFRRPLLYWRSSRTPPPLPCSVAVGEVLRGPSVVSPASSTVDLAPWNAGPSLPIRPAGK